MDATWMEEACISKPGAKKDYKEEWQATRFLIGEKMFAMFGGDKYGKKIVTLKCEPFVGQSLREEFPGKIIPGYYMNKEHWNSVYLDSGVPKETVLEMIEMSYRLVFNSLSKVKQEKALSNL